MSHSSLPPRKRQRLSSPTYDEQLELPSKDELKVIEQLELSLSQAPSHYRKAASSVPLIGVQDRLDSESPRNLDGPPYSPVPAPFPRPRPTPEHADPDDPFSSTSKAFTGFVPASSSRLQNTETGRLSPDSGPCDRDVGAEGSTAPIFGFTSASNFSKASVKFASASALFGGPASATRRGSPSPQQSQNSDDPTQTAGRFDSFGRAGDDAGVNPLSMFTSLGKKKDLFQPSAAAIKAALEREKRWEAEEDDVVTDDPSDKRTGVERQALLSVENISQRSDVPDQTVSGPANLPRATPGSTTSVSHQVGFSSASRVETGGSIRPATNFSTPSALGNTSFQTPSVSNVKGNASLKPFRSPLLNRSSMKTPGNRQSQPSLMNPATSTPVHEYRPAALVSSALSAVAPIPEARLSTPIPNKSTPMRKTPAGKFVTPFKLGMRPGEPGRAQLQAQINTTSGHTDDAQSTGDLTRKSSRRQFFDLKMPRNRKTLASSGLRPGRYSLEALAGIGLNVAELRNLSPKSAIQYRFRAASNVDPQGPTDALHELKATGWMLATQEWVDNHWSLILWKLAGMVALDPESEVDDYRKRWSWKEMMRQLCYRYEKELNGSARPALRLITTQDTSARLHMVLCVSDITWSQEGVQVGEDGLPAVPHPTLELSDGWYRLRARVDDILARAVRRDVIRVGRKIAISGASIPRDVEPCEVLEAYDRVELIITGNGTHLAPWHTKLGFQPYPAIATLNSISPDGGMIPCLELIVTKVYPIAFIEFQKDEDGNVTREGPRREKDELAAHDAWARKRDREYQRLRKEADDKCKLYFDWAQRFEAKSESCHPREEEDMPGHIESMFDECEYSSDITPVLRRASKAEAGWLARFTRDRVEKERETVELGTRARVAVRSFRVLLMRDARVTRRPARRVVELTCWDVLSLSFEGATAGHFKEGQRFQITNLMPTQKSAWMDRHAEDSHVYVSSSKISRWTKF
ncbi:hypothetical protein EDB83DRAFT_2517952 [Lactarius deliciosus]|nr:hypothetical protein EDB83DRAFT_2517952 [Lactarius deliciosus]